MLRFRWSQILDMGHIAAESTVLKARHIGTGKQAAVAKAEAIQTAFKRGSSVSSGGITATIERSPEIMAGYTDENRFIVNVKIWFFANIGA